MSGEKGGTDIERHKANRRKSSRQVDRKDLS